MLNSSVTGFVSTQSLGNPVKTFFGCHEGKLETFAKIVLQHHWKLCTKISPYESPRQQAVWKLLSEISRTAPGGSQELAVIVKAKKL